MVCVHLSWLTWTFLCKIYNDEENLIMGEMFYQNLLSIKFYQAKLRIELDFIENFIKQN
jgi:hypothetical protein